MSSKHPQHVNVVLECQGVQHDTTYAVAAHGLASLDAAQKMAKRLATAKPGTGYVPCRFWPGAVAEAKTVVRFFNPDRCANDGAGEAQQPAGARKEANDKQT